MSFTRLTRLAVGNVLAAFLANEAPAQGAAPAYPNPERKFAQAVAGRFHWTLGTAEYVRRSNGKPGFEAVTSCVPLTIEGDHHYTITQARAPTTQPTNYRTDPEEIKPLLTLEFDDKGQRLLHIGRGDKMELAFQITIAPKPGAVGPLRFWGFRTSQDCFDYLRSTTDGRAGRPEDVLFRR